MSVKVFWLGLGEKDVLNLAKEMNTQAPPRPKQARTASFSVLRICSFHTDLMGSTTIKRSVIKFVRIKAFRRRIWSMQ